MEKVLKFGDIEIQKQNFHQHQGLISIKNIDINKRVRSLLVKKGFKYFIGCRDPKNIKPLCIFFPKISAYRKDFHETKYIVFLLKYDELLEKCNLGKNIIKKEFDDEPVYNKKYLKAKIKSYDGKINTNFHNNKIPKEVSQYICLSVILLDSVCRTGKNYYPQVLSSDKENFDEIDSVMKTILMKKILMKKFKKC